MVSVIIVAGGDGKRFGNNIPKQFAKINDKELIDYSIETFNNNKNIDEIILVLPKKWINQFKDKYNDFILVEGGKTRQESSLNGLIASSKKTENILIHDASRPLVSEKIINDSLNFLNSFDAVCPYINTIDSIIEKKDDKFKYLNRDLVKKVQTPQGFKKQILLNAMINEHYNANDNISEVLHYDPLLKVKFFKGEKYNFKINFQR